MPTFTVIYGEAKSHIEVDAGITIGEAVLRAGLAFEQPCAGRGTCGLCKVLIENEATPPDEVERQLLTQGELALNIRLACRSQVLSDIRVVLSPVVVYSNKIFRSSYRYRRTQSPLGIAVDLGTTTVAAYLTMLDSGEVQAGGASLNQQTVFGADVISRLAAAINSSQNAERLHRLALASINQAVDSLQLSPRIRERLERVVIVGNVAMHHLLMRLPLHTLSVKPFQPYDRHPICNAASLMGGIFAEKIKVSLPPLIGGFVGSDALACLVYFGFDKPAGPMAAIDLGTNGEVMVTDGKRILVASTAAGPAFEGVNISCGSRAVDGAIVRVWVDGNDLVLQTIADRPPIGLTGSGLISVVHALRKTGVIEASGRILESPTIKFGRLVGFDRHGARAIFLTSDRNVWLSQWDVRELQKAKGAIRAATEVLMKQLKLQPDDLQRLILTGSFGAQVDIESALSLGMIPPVRPEVVETVANAAGLGAAKFLSDEGFALGEELATRVEQFDLDQDPDFYTLFINAMTLAPNNYHPS